MKSRTQHILRTVAEYTHARKVFDEAVAHGELLEQRWRRGMLEMMAIASDMDTAHLRIRETGSRVSEAVAAMEALE